MTTAADRDRLQRTLAMLARDGGLEYTGEYGAEITTFIPFVAWLKREGHLDGRRILTYRGMRPYYFFLDDDQYAEKDAPRRWLPVAQRYWPSNSTYHAVASPWHACPDYRRHYAGAGMRFARPLIFIQNKFTIEWNVGPINYLPLNGLASFLEATADRFEVVYSRPDSLPVERGYSKDHNAPLDYPDHAILARHPHVHHLERLCAESGLDYNRTKLEILAKSRIYVATQGGGAHILACFGGSLLLLLDRSEHFAKEGREYPHAYRHGPYKYLARVPPKLMVARNFTDFNAALDALGRASVTTDNKIRLPADCRPLLERLTL